MSILIWSLIGLLVYSSFVVFFFMELALDKPKKTESGKLRIKKNGFVIRYLYGVNVLMKKGEKFFPKNTCRLYKGVWVGIPCFILVPSVVSILIAFFFVLLYGVAGPFALIAGYWPNPVGFYKNGGDPFYPYEERKGYKEWIAPWKFILPIGLLALIYFFYREIFASLVAGLVKVSHPLSSNTAVIVYGGIAGLIFLVIVINKIRKTESFAATKETVISFVKKICKEVEITE